MVPPPVILRCARCDALRVMELTLSKVVALAAVPVQDAELPVMLMPQVPEASPPVRVGTLKDARIPVASVFLRKLSVEE